MGDENAVQQFGGWARVLETLVDGRDLTTEQASAAMEDILTGRATHAQIGGLLVGIQAKGETIEELVGFTNAMLGASQPLTLDVGTIDIVGTGGSKHRRDHALNVSTMASIVASAAGAVVCKHGNRKASSTSGSFDFLEALGVTIDLGPTQLQQCVAEIGLGFAFARSYHPAMRFAGPVRAELGIPTVFNQLGPLAHPGRPRRQVVGTANEDRAQATAAALKILGAEASWVVTGAGGLDELTTTGTSVVYEVSQEGVTRSEVTPEAFGLPVRTPGDLVGGSAQRNAEIFLAMVDGESSPASEIVALNAAAGLVIAGVVGNLGAGVTRSMKAMESGLVRSKLDQLVQTTADLGLSG